jgi:hypothetical protein
VIALVGIKGLHIGLSPFSFFPTTSSNAILSQWWFKQTFVIVIVVIEPDVGTYPD